jgi:hypothetical protein
VAISYLQSRVIGCPKLLWDVITHGCGRNQATQPDSDLEDPLPLQLRSAIVSYGGGIASQSQLWLNFVVA